MKFLNHLSTYPSTEINGVTASIRKRKNPKLNLPMIL